MNIFVQMKTATWWVIPINANIILVIFAWVEGAISRGSNARIIIYVRKKGAFLVSTSIQLDIQKIMSKEKN